MGDRPSSTCDRVRADVRRREQAASVAAVWRNDRGSGIRDRRGRNLPEAPSRCSANATASSLPRELRFVDSAGVSVLIRAKNQAAAEGRQLVLRQPTAQVHAIFALVGLVAWLVFDDR
jgi:ABC-type transporter Mla MlaB component